MLVRKLKKNKRISGNYLKDVLGAIAAAAY
jgi:hypothetical protein